MIRRLSVLLAGCALLAAPAAAREGFSLQLGLGGGFFELNSGALDSALTEIGRVGERRLLSSPLADGLAVRFALAYNIK
ncbi:MAG TPA: hypothetical protein P5076_24710, partial [Myxococcota bacterium]|nr:hypothetical protein [Myxococcota bacterium]